ncbi:hypothetical protein ACQZ4Z_13005 [Agrobacterium vitis]|uniref:hypothetical protein n=1 Tax=Agrobacterium vitis TaxID=373 RepID=UPI001571C956|nr:hypothetical protein [Agrobacterium vitis]NSZ42833.1 hypothetical protein [Agrobacterium vitis]
MPSVKPYSVVAATLAVDRMTHDGALTVLNRAAGIAVTLPAATGTGAVYEFMIGTTITSNSTTIKVANSIDVMSGTAINAQDGGDTAIAFETAVDSDTITLNGTTTGGIKGDRIKLVDAASGLWAVNVVGSATGAEVTPFSATV